MSPSGILAFRPWSPDKSRSSSLAFGHRSWESSSLARRASVRLARSSDESEQKPGVSPSSSLGFGRCSPDDSEQQQQPALWPALAGRVTCRGLRPPPARRVRAATAWAKRHRSSDESPSPFLPHARQTSPSSNFWPLLPTFWQTSRSGSLACLAAAPNVAVSLVVQLPRRRLF